MLSDVRYAATLLILAIVLGGCGFLGLGTAGGWCNWSGTRIAFQGHTTLEDASLPDSPEVGPAQFGELVVTADPVPLPGLIPEFSAPPTDPPSARMYCFHPDGSNVELRGVLPNGWSPPGDDS